MGKGQRHSKNAGVMGAEGLSYAERKGLGYGTLRERIGKDSHGNYDDCMLTLQPAVDPVATPYGHLFSKEPILENLLAQKKAIKRRIAEWEAAQAEEARQVADKAALEQQAELIAFDRANHMGTSKQTLDQIKVAIETEAAALADPKKGAASVINIKEAEERVKTLKAFWMPSKTPEAKATVAKPDENTYCPASGKKLRLKDLIPVKWTEAPEDSEKGRHMDPLTKDVFTNVSKLVLLKETGDVVFKETYEKLIKPEGRFNGKRIKEVVELQQGSSGFAAHDGEKVQSKAYFMLGVGSGRQDQRGQAGAGRSLGGLVFNN